ncbi:MAG: Hpt domain-containing protein [Nitrospira sp.]|nr:Hpt domain-containing protein [Nitrospira sp.]
MGAESHQSDLIRVFVSEASDGARMLAEALRANGEPIPPPHELHEHYIVAHRLRGASALYGYGGISQLSAELELILERADDIAPDDWPTVVSAMREVVGGLAVLIQGIGQDGSEDANVVTRCLGLLERLQVLQPAASVSLDYVHPTIDVEILSYFTPEAEEYLRTIDDLVRMLRATRDHDDAIHRLFRAIHTLKGSAYTVGFEVIGDIVRPMEDGMIAVKEKRLKLTDHMFEVFENATRTVQLLLRRDPQVGYQLQRDVPVLIHQLRQICEGTVSTGPAIGGPTGPDVLQTGPAIPEPVVSVEVPPADLSDAYLLPELDPEVLSYFVPEAQDYLELLESNLLRLDKDPQNRELINQLFRTAHTLKGSAYTVGFQSIGDLVHHVEDFMGAVRDGRLVVRSGHTDLILRSVDVVRVLMRRDLGAVSGTRQRFSTTRSDLKRLDQEASGDVPPSGLFAETSRDSVPAAISTAKTVDKDKPTEAKSLEDREVIRVSYGRLERLMNLVGELVIGRGRLEQRLRVLEQLSQQVLVFKSRLVDSVQSFSDKHTFTYQETPNAATAVPMQGPAAFGDFGSLELDKYDDFNILARRISEVTADISESLAQLNGSIHRAHDDMSQLQQLTLLMRDEIAHARMVPIGTPFTRFRRAVREIARASNKEVTLVTSGEQTEVDTGVVERLVDPLVHLVRNAVYHGIEPAADRLAKGKPPVGTIHLHAAHRGNSMIVEVEDDGAGLDLVKIRAKVVKMGLVDAQQIDTISDAEILQSIFLPGFSTAEKVGDQAGRGVGLDVVKRAIEGMNGHIAVESEPGVGTKFTLSLPVTLLIATALIVRSGAERYAIPLLHIQEVTMPTASSWGAEGERTFLQVGEQIIEVQSLHHMLRRECFAVTGMMPVVIVRTAGGLMGLAVDELLGRQEVVIKSLGQLKPFMQSFFGGATIDPEGRVILVVDPTRLVGRNSKESRVQAVVSKNQLQPQPVVSDQVRSAEQQDVRLLLVDDSLSIRKFVGKMLESAGYQVDTAVDGEDGLRKASTFPYSMILTDLEMPKLNGFEVIQALRRRSETRETPVVVMTTRAGDKHRQMAINIGANSYIAKPVEERMLLQEVERWMGRARTFDK